MVQTDKGYRGKPRCWTWYDQPSHEERKQGSLVRARHETVNSRFKVFKCLSTAFRHPLHKHHFCFRAVAAIVQLGLRRDSPLFHVDYVEFGHLANVRQHQQVGTNTPTVATAAEAADAAEGIYNHLRVVDLKDLCRERRLVLGGRRADLIDRLQQYDEACGDVPW